MTLALNLIGAALLFAAQGPVEPVRVEIPINAAGEVDLAEVVTRLASKAGVKIARPPTTLRLPVHGLAGALTRTLLEESLGSGVKLRIAPSVLIVSLRPEHLDQRSPLQDRVEDLADRVRREAASRPNYGLHALKSYRPNDQTRPTICLVHGMNSSTGGFVHVITALERAGFGLVSYDFPYNQDLDQTAPAFGRDWTAFRTKVGEHRPWAVLTHSMGGLIARSYVEGDSYGNDVSDLILIAPPSRGAAVAKAQGLLQLVEGVQAVNGQEPGALAVLSGGLGAAADDLSPGSAFLRSLNTRPRRKGVHYHILAGDKGFLTEKSRKRIEARIALTSRVIGLVGGLARLASNDLKASFDELTDGTGDGCVAVSSTRLDGVTDHETIHANHVELIRGPMLYPDPGPVACIPFVLKRLGSPRPATEETNK
ncbi:MAG: alpha/beta fold hydrolase [Isosphaeraceae bacterium]